MGFLGSIGKAIKKILPSDEPSAEYVAGRKAEILAEIEETSKRFKEAAEKRADPKTVAGFASIETDTAIKNSSLYPMIKDICMALTLKGYKCGSARLTDKYESHSAEIFIYPNKFPNDEKDGSGIDPKKAETSKGVWQSYHYKDGFAPFLLGTIEFFDYIKPEALHFLNSFYEDEYPSEGGFLEKNYMIHHLPHLVIDSNISPPEKPPEWLMICANVLRRYSPPVTDPEWVRKNPDAKKYVNVMFR